MQVPDAAKSKGRPGVPVAIWNTAVELTLEGKTAKEVQAATGLCLTKVYEVRRNPTKKEAPPLAQAGH